MNTTFLRLALTASCLALAACGGDADAAGERTSDLAAAKKAAGETFRYICVTCHGDVGHGDGPGAASCNPKPRSFADAVWQASVTDEQIIRTVIYGGAAVGKSPQMPAQPQLEEKTELLRELVKIVRSFAAN